ncbi:MAG TPA: hypothetical protein VFM88_15955, partial [Vicinamibacteria bacterium]|nr:hypothetical protein [Vicinamibacteria bacterium]
MLRALGLAALVAVAPAALAQRFLPDDPLLADRDDLPIAKPGEVELSTAWDVIEHSFWHRPSGQAPPALNVNTLGEVPDSSWFQNRIGTRAMAVEELVRGPNQDSGPADGPWTITAGKSQGITPGFTIRDERGGVYFIKFDPIPYPNLSTSADVIVTKFFHALGYFVPENHIAYFRPEQLLIDPDAKVPVRGGKKRKMAQADLDGMLSHVPRRSDGRIRCVASRRLPGEPLGPHKHWGTRSDDPNDAFPHEHRRDQRGYRVFCAWLNHDDSRSVNSQDTFVRGGDGRGYVKHHLIDFSSTLGAGSDVERRIAPQNPRAGNEYILELKPILKTAFSLGLWERPWRRVQYRVFTEVGRLEAEFFEPHAWKPEYPNPAFERMRPADAFWAARIVSRFSDEAVRALVHAGEFDDVEAERHLADTLIRRRDKIVAYYFRQMNPLAEFRIADGGAALAGEHHQRVGEVLAALLEVAIGVDEVREVAERGLEGAVGDGV